MSAGLIGAIVVLMAGAPGLRKESPVIAEAGIRFSAEAQKVIWQYSRQSYGQAEIYKSRLLDAIATLTKGSNPLTDTPRESSLMWSASGEAVGAPVALSGLASPVTGDLRSAQVKADNFELKSRFGRRISACWRLLSRPPPRMPWPAQLDSLSGSRPERHRRSHPLPRHPHRNLLIAA